MAEAGLDLRIARVYSEQDPAFLKEQLGAGRIRPLAPHGPLEPGTLENCAHIVGMMGHEPFAEALEAGAQVVLAGRATDTALAAAVPLMRGMPAGPAWHAAKVVECGGQCTTDPRAGGVMATIDADGFVIEPSTRPTSAPPPPSRPTCSTRRPTPSACGNRPAPSTSPTPPTPPWTTAAYAWRAPASSLPPSTPSSWRAPASPATRRCPSPVSATPTSPPTSTAGPYSCAPSSPSGSARPSA
ncbi:hypothetical protein SHKM778_50130 [Streptomyces sp. KM77-8]|uniref:Acyclic terpene utilisation N-terminal domain-containing protein n=1 Tax=Streptomyces haneummycinicus TaxID=3074435 RepID=A0AAT9HMH2_9ACTN